jgi:uncharacterized Fe-S cluster-containing protein
MTQPPRRGRIVKDALNRQQQGPKIHKTVNVPPSEIKKGAAVKNCSFPNTNTKKKKKKKKKKQEKKKENKNVRGADKSLARPTSLCMLFDG